jgi:hypothetical protein
MSLAFGWFLLIFFGTIEADIFGTKHLNAPYKAIFFRFFNPEHGRIGFEATYGFLMDLILAFILSGLLLAVIKRFYSRVVGMKKTTRLKFHMWRSRYRQFSYRITGSLACIISPGPAYSISFLVALFHLFRNFFHSSSDFPIYAHPN